MSRQRLLGFTSESCCPPIATEALSADDAAELARGFKALGDPVRLRLLSLIAARGGGEVCVCDLTDAFTLTGPTISHHLKVLREAGLVASERRGTWVYYRVVPGKLAALSQLLHISTATTGSTDTTSSAVTTGETVA